MKSREAALRIGQAAAQLGASPHHLRQLCRAGMIEAEQSAGGQWRIPLAQVERLAAEGVPPAPSFIEDDAADDAAPPPRSNRLAPPSPAVVEAHEDAEIEEACVRRKESTVRKLRLQLEEQQARDDLAARDREHATVEAEQRRKAEAAQAERDRRTWRDNWLVYSLRSLPHGAQRETEIEVHATVESALAALHPSQPHYVIQRVVDAAVAKAIRPWTHRQEIKRAVESAMSTLPLDVRAGSEFAALRQRTLEVARASVEHTRADASYGELEAAAVLAVRPMVAEAEHFIRCRRALSYIYVSGASSTEQVQAKDAAWKAVAALPVGATEEQIRGSKETALAPLVAAIAAREKVVRLRREAEFSAALQFDHIVRYLQGAYDWGSHGELVQECDRLRPLIKAALVEELMQRPEMGAEAIRRRIEKLCDEL